MHQNRKAGLILGIESSCDETAAAVVREGVCVLSNIVASQIALHADYGGVVPELASREHLRNIVPVVREAIREARVEYADLNAVAVTEGPGLAGALLVGITFAKSLAYGLGVPLIGVNHLEGHIHAVLMESQGVGGRVQGIEERLTALVVSGGHTHLYLAHQDQDTWRYRNVGRTVDDAAGEAYDKVAKLLGLGYPGGPWIDALAAYGDPKAVPFTFCADQDAGVPAWDIDAEQEGAPDLTGPSFDFSFSGIKTAVLRYVETNGMKAGIEERRKALAEIPEAKPADAIGLCGSPLFDKQTLDLIASFQYAVVANLIRQTFAAAEAFGAKSILVSGGVAANRELRKRFLAEGQQRGVEVAFPSLALSTDNAAMIAAAAWPKFLAGDFAGDGLVATPQLKLG